MAGRNFSLTSKLSSFVDRQVESGRHQNASEVVREALRRYEDDVERDTAERAALLAIADRGIEAIEAGDFTLIEGEDGARALLDRLSRQVEARAIRRTAG